MSIESAEDLAGMELAGSVTRAVLNAMKEAVRYEHTVVVTSSGARLLTA